MDLKAGYEAAAADLLALKYKVIPVYRGEHPSLVVLRYYKITSDMYFETKKCCDLRSVEDGTKEKCIFSSPGGAKSMAANGGREKVTNDHRTGSQIISIASIDAKNSTENDGSAEVGEELEENGDEFWDTCERSEGAIFFFVLINSNFAFI